MDQITRPDAPAITKQFVVDNNHFTMREVVTAMYQDNLDVCTAFLDAYGIATVGQAARDGELRLLVGYDLSDVPIANDIVTFEMAREWRETGIDPVNRVPDDASLAEALEVLNLPTFQAAKAALRTHSKLYVNKNLGVVGSSNVTRAGLEGQRELNLIQHEFEAVVRLREWFSLLWEDAKEAERSPFKEELIEWLKTSRLQQFAPFHPYAKAIFERYRHRFLSFSRTAGDVDLAVFQEEGRDTALSILAEHGCCIIADAVGLGKTYVALGAVQRRAQARPRNQRTILVICPAQLEEVWHRAGRDQGIAITTESMETLGYSVGESAEARLRDLQNYYLIIVDEAHNFRNGNTNRFRALMELIQGGPADKELLLLTATPINNSIGDLYSLYRLMTKDNDDFFNTTNLRVRSLREFFRRVEKENASTTDLLLETMVCRSRLDIRQRQESGEVIVINGKEVRFPERRMEALEYSLSTDGIPFSYDGIAATIESLTLGAYNVENYSQNPDAQKKQTFMRLQTLFRILLLKRLESSVASFISTAEQLLRFSDRVVEALKQGRQLTNDEYRRLQLDLFRQVEDDDATGESSAYFESLTERNPNEYDIERLEMDVLGDHALLQPLIDQAKELVGKPDGKIACLKKRLLELLPDQKVLLFTFYSDTAEYIFRELTSDKDFLVGIKGARVELITGGVKPKEKSKIVSEFAPKANDRQNDLPKHPIQLLISTDVLSEGQNLQDCGFLINYDLHFNPVRMIQRNGRIDRLFSEHQEITIANFFPEGGLEEQLKIVERLQKKIEHIQESLPMDQSVIGEKISLFSLEQLRRAKQGDATLIDEIDANNPINRFHDTLDRVVKLLVDFGIEQVQKIPFGCQSNKRSTKPGVFLCVAAGKREDPNRPCWWLYYEDPKDITELGRPPLQDVSEILPMIESQKPASESLYHPEITPREIRWDVILDAAIRCRQMLVRQKQEEARGQVWPPGHINKKIQVFFAPRPEPLPERIEQGLGRHSLDRHRKEAEALLKESKQTRDTSKLFDWLDEKLPNTSREMENAETIPLEIVSYLELVPETEVAR